MTRAEYSFPRLRIPSTRQRPQRLNIHLLIYRYNAYIFRSVRYNNNNVVIIITIIIIIIVHSNLYSRSNFNRFRYRRARRHGGSNIRVQYHAVMLY